MKVATIRVKMKGSKRGKLINKTDFDPKRDKLFTEETPKAEAPKAEAPKAEAPKAEAPKAEAPKAAPPKAAPPVAPAKPKAAATAKDKKK